MDHSYLWKISKSLIKAGNFTRLLKKDELENFWKRYLILLQDNEKQLKKEAQDTPFRRGTY